MTETLRCGPLGDPDRYELHDLISAGSEGVVWRGAGPGGAPVAVKELQPAHHVDFDTWAAAWQGQAELLGRAMVPGLVRVREAFVGPAAHRPGRHDPETRALWCALDWVDGERFDPWIARHPQLGPEQRLGVLVPVAAALDLLHSGHVAGGSVVLHGDVKPANIIVADGAGTLVDIGSLRAGTDGSGWRGTLGYVAPEVRAGAAGGPAADRWALGAVAWFALCGTEPPAAAEETQLRTALHAAVPATPELAEHVMAMLASDPAARPSSAANWVAQLRRSSLPHTGGEVLLPRAPARTETPAADAGATPESPLPMRRRVRLLGAAAAVPLVLLGVAQLADGGDGPTGSPATTFELPGLTRPPSATTTTTTTTATTTVAARTPASGPASSTTTSVSPQRRTGQPVIVDAPRRGTTTSVPPDADAPVTTDVTHGSPSTTEPGPDPPVTIPPDAG